MVHFINEKFIDKGFLKWALNAHDIEGLYRVTPPSHQDGSGQTLVM